MQNESTLEGQPLNDACKLNLQFREIEVTDIKTMKMLCTEWFPIRYDNKWYEDVAVRKDVFLSIVADLYPTLTPNNSNPTVTNVVTQENIGNTNIYKNANISGLLVAEVKPIANCCNEDRSVISEFYQASTGVKLQGENHLVCYILILGVRRELRRHNIASALIKELENRIPERCDVVFLHALDSNFPAILFYEKQKFQRLSCLSSYYVIDGTEHSGYCYAKIKSRRNYDINTVDDEHDKFPDNIFEYPNYFSRKLTSWMFRQFERFQL
ncbi:hypothetical protein GJ496_000030 [Pomphorhynchus laevis]|nr:hypothetical protein GJ496_000030 [Pomphorhynchus laevis]